MAFRQVAGTAIVPTLSRLVLAVAFTTVGYNKLFEQVEFAPEQAQVLRELGVGLEPVGDAAVPEGAEVRRDAAPARAVRFASWQEAPPSAGGATADPVAPDAPDAGTLPPPVRIDPAGGEDDADADDAGTAEDSAAAPLPTGPGRGLALHRITLLVSAAELPQPVLLAWVAALTEFLGGIFLLFGLLTRIWGLGLAIAMGTAFYLVSMNAAGLPGVTPVHTVSPLAYAQDIGAYNRVVSQLSLLVLAFGLLLTGAGPLSLDALVFARKDPDPDPAPPSPSPSRGPATRGPAIIGPDGGSVTPTPTTSAPAAAAAAPAPAEPADVPLEAAEAPEAEAPEAEEKPRPRPTQSFGGEGRPL